MFVPFAGAVVAERYELERAIGRGGMGEVWRAHDRDLDSPCAVKFISGHLASDSVARARILQEARAVARLRSPHVVHVLGVGEHEDAMYLAMELLEGENLEQRLARTRTLDTPLTLTVIDQVARALDKVHAAGFVHRDLKPANIWLGTESEPFVKLLDFGVAKSSLGAPSRGTPTGSLIGTPHYMSPEQALGSREVDHRSDLWALAVIAVECLSGKLPFVADGLGELLVNIVTAPVPALSELAPELPPSLQTWWARALAADPDRRFQTATELSQRLRACFIQTLKLLPAPALPAAQLAPMGAGSGDEKRMARPSRARQLWELTGGRSIAGVHSSRRFISGGDRRTFLSVSAAALALGILVALWLRGEPAPPPFSASPASTLQLARLPLSPARGDLGGAKPGSTAGLPSSLGAGASVLDPGPDASAPTAAETPSASELVPSARGKRPRSAPRGPARSASEAAPPKVPRGKAPDQVDLGRRLGF